jgi:hypothetical protein
MTEFKIHPPAHVPHAAGRPCKYPFSKLVRAGQSFFIPGKTTTQLGGLVRYWNRVLKPKRFTSRMYDDAGNREAVKGPDGKRIEGIRIWRIK